MKTKRNVSIFTLMVLSIILMSMVGCKNIASEPAKSGVATSEPSKYTVTYDANGGTGAVPNAQTKIPGVSLQLASKSGTLRKTNFSFIGWNTAKNGTGISYSEGSNYTIDKEVTLYANWANKVGSATEVASYLDRLSSGSYTVAVNETSTDLSISEKIKDVLNVLNAKQDIKVNLDLSKVTGWTSIETSVFQGRSALTSVTIPDSVTSIGQSAFIGCSALVSVTIPKGVTSIPDSAFYGCNALTSVTIPDRVTSIGQSAFNGCSALTNVTIPDSVTSIGQSAFIGCSALTSVTIPEGVTSISDSAFSGCSALTSVTIPDRVTTIGETAFLDCKKLTSLTIPDRVTTIGGGAFAGCSVLTSVTIPDRVTTIGGGAFAECSALTSVTIPDSVTSIELGAFYGCNALTSVTFPAGSTWYASATSPVEKNESNKITVTNPQENATNLKSGDLKDKYLLRKRN